MARIFTFYTKCSDLNIDYCGYVPDIKGFEIRIDLDTMKVIGMESLTDDQLREVFDE